MAENKEATTNSKVGNYADSTVFLLIVVAIAVVVNVILALPSTPTYRADLTEDKLYTLSPASKELVGALEEDVEIKFFISENLQYPDHSLEQRVSDMLEEYRANSNGRLSFEVIHPDGEEEADKEKRRNQDSAEATEDDKKDEEAEEPNPDDEGPKGFGIQKIPVGVQGDDQVGLRLVYKGMAFIAGDRHEVIRDVKGTDNLEYEISKRIKLLVTPDEAKHKVGFVAGFGGPADQEQFVQSINGAFQQIYGDLMTATSVRPGEADIPEDVDALIVLNPQTQVNEAALFRIDQFLMKGKGVAWLQTTLAPDPRMPMLPMRTPVVTGIEPMFKTYGLELNQDLILDRKNNIVSMVLTMQGLAQVSNPTMPLFTDISKTSIITKDIPTLSFPMGSSLTVGAAALDNDAIEVFELVKTEPEAVKRVDITTVDFEKISEPQKDETSGAFLMAAALQGSMKSHYAGKEPPAGVTAAEVKGQAETGARIVVAGNGDFMFPNPQTGYGRQYSSLGAIFLLNMVDWLVQDEALISIRSKGIPRVITEVDAEEHTTYQFGNIVGVPALFGLIGLGFWFFRRQRKANLELS